MADIPVITDVLQRTLSKDDVTIDRVFSEPAEPPLALELEVATNNFGVSRRRYHAGGGDHVRVAWLLVDEYVATGIVASEVPASLVDGTFVIIYVVVLLAVEMWHRGRC